MCMLALVVRICIANPYEFNHWIIWLVIFWFLSLFPLVTVTFSFLLISTTYFGRSWADARISFIWCHDISLIIFPHPLFSHPSDSLHTISVSPDCISLFYTSAHIIRIVFLNSKHTNLNISTNWRFEFVPSATYELTYLRIARSLLYYDFVSPIWTI